jgi:hypothetical protein
MNTDFDGNARIYLKLEIKKSLGTYSVIRLLCDFNNLRI